MEWSAGDDANQPPTTPWQYAEQQAGLGDERRRIIQNDERAVRAKERRDALLAQASGLAVRGMVDRSAALGITNPGDVTTAVAANASPSSGKRTISERLTVRSAVNARRKADRVTRYSGTPELEELGKEHGVLPKKPTTRTSKHHNRLVNMRHTARQLHELGEMSKDEHRDLLDGNFPVAFNPKDPQVKTIVEYADAALPAGISATERSNRLNRLTMLMGFSTKLNEQADVINAVAGRRKQGYANPRQEHEDNLSLLRTQLERDRTIYQIAEMHVTNQETSLVYKALNARIVALGKDLGDPNLTASQRQEMAARREEYEQNIEGLEAIKRQQQQQHVPNPQIRMAEQQFKRGVQEINQLLGDLKGEEREKAKQELKVADEAMQGLKQAFAALREPASQPASWLERRRALRAERRAAPPMLLGSLAMQAAAQDARIQKYREAADGARVKKNRSEE